MCPHNRNRLLADMRRATRSRRRHHLVRARQGQTENRSDQPNGLRRGRTYQPGPADRSLYVPRMLKQETNGEHSSRTKSPGAENGRQGCNVRTRPAGFPAGLGGYPGKLGRRCDIRMAGPDSALIGCTGTCVVAHFLLEQNPSWYEAFAFGQVGSPPVLVSVSGYSRWYRPHRTLQQANPLRPLPEPLTGRT
jgi:hypothetical protein